MHIPLRRVTDFKTSATKLTAVIEIGIESGRVKLPVIWRAKETSWIDDGIC